MAEQEKKEFEHLSKSYSIPHLIDNFCRIHSEEEPPVWELTDEKEESSVDEGNEQQVLHEI